MNDEGVTFEGAFTDSAVRLRDLSEQCFRAAIGADPRMMNEEVQASMLSLAAEDSSISTIRYFSTEQGNRTDACALEAHADTGLMTLLIASDVSGLEVEERGRNRWCRPEELSIVKESIAQGRVVVFCLLGRKFVDYSSDSPYSPCVHRVMIPTQEQRQCMLYFMTVGKEA